MGITIRKSFSRTELKDGEDSWWLIRPILEVRDIVIWIVSLWLEMLADVSWFWRNKIRDYFTSSDETSSLKKRIGYATSYTEWEDIAYKLDGLLGNDIWRQNPVSRKYDYKLISGRLKELVYLRENGQVDELMDKLRSGLLRNIGSVGAIPLYNRAYSGTKLLIEDYINEVILSLEFIDKHQGETRPPAIQRQLDFFHDTRQSFGSSALILHGGSLFGLCHIGIVKALHAEGLLPRIISGATVGALVAALICCHSDNDLSGVLNHLSSQLPPLDKEYSDIDYHSVMESILSSFCPPEIIMFEKYVCDKLGDLTFEEAYLKTDRVLNITVTPKYQGGTTNNIPNLLNYLTAPHVVIWSAARASIGTGVIHKNVELLVKNHRGEIERYQNSRVDFSPANRTVYISTRDSPYTRLSELFNVNSFIVSLARPYFAPILLSDFKHRGYQGWRIRLLKLFRLEFQHRLEQMTKLGLLPGIVQQLFVDENIPNAFQVTVVPELTSLFRDLGKIFDSANIKDKVDYWIFVGERSVWPMLTIIWARCAIEFVLDDIYNKKRELYTATN